VSSRIRGDGTLLYRSGCGQRHEWRWREIVLNCLVIQDELDTSNSVYNGLEQAGFNVVLCGNGSEGLRHAASDAWDVVIIDRLLPGGMDGVSIVEKLRDLGKTAPIVIVSALTSTAERVRGLHQGADDYISKPFAFSELLARVQALLRRSRHETALRLQVADLTVDLRAIRVARGDTPVLLQPREFRLLVYLMRHVDQVVTRAMLLEAVWEARSKRQNSLIDVQISRLRGKVDRGFSPRLIHTIRGVGYLLGTRR
jgi:two-component system, OmpR family, response regulator